MVASFNGNSAGGVTTTGAAVESAPVDPPCDPHPAAANAVNDKLVIEEFLIKFRLFISNSDLGLRIYLKSG
jgi:hypothetical protein